MTGLPVVVDNDTSFESTVFSVALGARPEAPVEIVSYSIITREETAELGCYVRLGAWLACWWNRDDVVLADSEMRRPRPETPLEDGLVPAF